MSDYWSDYWKVGHLSSFAQSSKDNYSGEIASFWEEFLRDYNHSHCNIVDIGCGNGALTDLALNKFKYTRPNFIGVDAAKLSIPKHLLQERVRFYQNTRAETLPLESHTIDIAISQFGFEYTDMGKVLEELSRTLKLGGKVCFVIHHKDSIIVKPNVLIRQAVDEVMVKNGPFDLLSMLVNSIHKTGKNNPVAEKYRHSLNTQIQQLSHSNKFGLYGTGFPDLLKNTMSSSSIDFKSRKNKLKNFRCEMKTLAKRLDNLLSVALDSDRIAGLLMSMSELGFTNVSQTPLRQGNELLGVSIRATLILPS